MSKYHPVPHDVDRGMRFKLDKEKFSRHYYLVEFPMVNSWQVHYEQSKTMYRQAQLREN